MLLEASLLQRFVAVLLLWPSLSQGCRSRALLGVLVPLQICLSCVGVRVRLRCTGRSVCLFLGCSRR